MRAPFSWPNHSPKALHLNPIICRNKNFMDDLGEAHLFQTHQYSSLQKVESNFPSLECGPNSVTSLLTNRTWQMSDVLKLSHKTYYHSRLTYSRVIAPWEASCHVGRTLKQLQGWVPTAKTEASCQQSWMRILEADPPASVQTSDDGSPANSPSGTSWGRLRQKLQPSCSPLLTHKAMR